MKVSSVIWITCKEGTQEEEEERIYRTVRISDNCSVEYVGQSHPDDGCKSFIWNVLSTHNNTQRYSPEIQNLYTPN
jgi:hypothetical protein